MGKKNVKGLICQDRKANAKPKARLASSERVRGCKRHLLKTWPEYFEKIVDGTKTFEVRKNDRNFQVGDELELREYIHRTDQFTGRKVVCRVAYILRGPAFGVKAGWCVMALATPNGALCSAEDTSQRETKKSSIST